MNKFPDRGGNVHPGILVLASLLFCLALQAGAGTSNTWVNTAGGTYDWNADTNWSPATFPNSVDAVADLAIDLAGAQVVNVNTQITVGILKFGDTSGQTGGQTIQPGTSGSLVMSVSSGQALIQRKNGNTSKATTISANIRLDSTTVVDNSVVSGAFELILSGGISGSGGLIKTNASSSLGVFLGGYEGNANTYSGLTVVAGGTLYANKNGVTAIPGDVLIKSGAKLGLERNDNIADTSVITIEGNGVLRLSTRSNGSASDTIGGLASASSTSTVINAATSASTAVLALNDNSNRTFAGSFQETTSTNRLAVIKKGTGIWTLSGTSSNAGTMTVDGGGGVMVDGALCVSPVTLTNNGTLGGSGVISGAVKCVRGKLAPGANGAAGTLTLAGGLSVVTSLTNLWQLGSLSESGNYDQLAIAGGTAALGYSCIVTLDFSLLPADQRPDASALASFWRCNRSWTIVKAAGGTISGQFAKISNATDYAGAKGSFSLSGGNGSDVVLNWQSPPPDSTTILFR